MNRRWLLTLVAAQIAFLFFIALSYYSVEWFGKEIKLQTAPVDPRDLLYGDYVILNYEISRVPTDLLKENVDVRDVKSIYVKLDTSGEYAVPISVHTSPPEGTYLKGKVRYLFDDEYFDVDYGIERYYVEENTGLELEEKRGQFDVIVKKTAWGQKISRLQFIATD